MADMFMGYLSVSWFKVFVSFRGKKPKYEIWAEGTPDYHLMDWRGMNFHRKRVPELPSYNTFAEAKKVFDDLEERRRKRSEGFSFNGYGQHINEYFDPFNNREVDHELTQQEYDEMKELYKIHLEDHRVK